MTFEINPNITNKESINGLPAIIGGLQQDQSNIQNTINTKQTAFSSPYKDFKVVTEQDVYIANSAYNANVTLYSNDGITWSSRTNSGLFGDFVTDIAYGNGKFVAVNTNGQIFVSEDGYTWSFIGFAAGSGYGYNSPIYANGVFVLLNHSNGEVLVSSDPQFQWSNPTNPGSGNVFRFPPTYAEGKFVAIRIDGKTIYSEDGYTWSLGTELGGGDLWIAPITYGDGIFITPKYNSNQLAYSSDGVTWNVQNTFPISFMEDGITYADNKFVAIEFYGDVRYSLDDSGNPPYWIGTGYNLPGSGYRRPAYANGKFVSVTINEGYTVYSSNGITWSLGTPLGGSGWNSVNFVNDKFISISSNGKIAYSLDGVNWNVSQQAQVSSWYKSPIYQKIIKAKTIGQILGI